MTAIALRQIQNAVKNKYTPNEIADEIERRHRFATLIQSEDVLIYENGRYVENGESVIQSETEILEPECTNQFCKEVSGHIKRSTFRQRQEFDKDDRIINVANGLIDITNGKLSPHTSNYLSRRQLPIEYDPKARCPGIMAFLNEVTLDPEDKRALLEHAAYVLIRSNFLQKAFLYVGEGANGKSTWFKILMALVGAENVVSESIHDLETNRFACASLDGKLVNLYADVNATELSHTGRLKLLISGDSIRAEKKHKPVFTLYNHCKLFFSANQLPQVQDLTDAWLRRWIILTWRRKFENENQDRTLIENLTTPGELSGLLNVLVALAKRLLQTRTLSYEPTAQQVRAEWILKADIMQAFLSSEVKVENGSYVSKTELYQKYVDWSITKHFAPKGRRSFNEAVQAKLPVRENWVKPGGRGGKTVRVWRDIALNASSSTRSTESNARISSKPDKIKGREVEKESQANCGNRGTLEDFSEPIGE